MTKTYQNRVERHIKKKATEFKFTNLLKTIEAKILVDEGYEEQGIPEIGFISRRQDVYYQDFSKSKQFATVYQNILSGIHESTHQVLCEANARE